MAEEGELLDTLTEDEQHERAVLLARQQELEEIDDLRQLLQLPQFRRFIWRAIKPYVTPGDYTGDPDLMSVGKWIGERHVGNAILDKLLTADPLVYTSLYSEDFLRMKREKDYVDASV